ncbi:hypothetical protein [Ammoniphilus sp. 3BR4]|uniref:hypothetical protein n=1 Tax=Ammoniphilus sp. 3BR4 TaxID=3158265 RepID=UPI0034652C08
MDIQQAQSICKKHINRYVEIQMKDGKTYDGIVESVDDQNVYLAVPRGGSQRISNEGRQFGFGFPWYGYGGFGYPWYGYGYPGYGFGYGRFRRLALPLALLAGLTLLPYY